MNDLFFKRVALASLIASSTFLLCACGAGVTGTYTNANGMVTLDLKSGGKASIAMMGENESCTYEVDGKNLNLTCSGGKTIWGIHDDGSISGPGFIGTLKKSKS
jgi:hypothetical protein